MSLVCPCSQLWVTWRHAAAAAAATSSASGTRTHVPHPSLSTPPAFAPQICVIKEVIKSAHIVSAVREFLDAYDEKATGPLTFIDLCSGTGIHIFFKKK
jgi:hypothetical protein